MNVAGGENQQRHTSHGYPGQGAPYGAPPPPGQYAQQGYPPGPPPGPPPAQPYGYAPPPTQAPYGGSSYRAPPQPYGQPPPPGGYGYGGPPGPPPSQGYAPPPRDVGYGGPPPGGPPPPSWEPPPLPPGWSAHWDAYRGRPYYVELTSGSAEWFLPAERGSLSDPALATAVGGGAKSKGHGTGALVAAGAAGVIGGALLGGLARHEEHKVANAWDDKREDWKEDREDISEDRRRFDERVHEHERNDFREVAEDEGEYKADEEEGYERRLEDDDDD